MQDCVSERIRVRVSVSWSGWVIALVSRWLDEWATEKVIESVSIWMRVWLIGWSGGCVIEYESEFVRYW